MLIYKLDIVHPYTLCKERKSKNQNEKEIKQ